MAYSEEWISYPAEGENGKTVIVTLRDQMDSFRESGKYIYRIDVNWKYSALPDGMPDERDSALLETATEGLLKAFKKDHVAVMTGIYTGDGSRDWVFYTRSLPIFQKVFNRGLECVDETLPLVIEAEEDAAWEEYTELLKGIPGGFDTDSPLS